MNVYSVMTKLLRPTTDGSAAFEDRPPILLPRTAADELPPYREQPWIIDRRGYRKIDPSRLIKAAGKNRYGHRDATMLLVCYRHGLRASELVSLESGPRSTSTRATRT